MAIKNNDELVSGTISRDTKLKRSEKNGSMRSRMSSPGVLSSKK